MPTQDPEAMSTLAEQHSLFGEVRTIGRKVDELQKAQTTGIEILNGKLDLVLAKLASIEARDIRIEHEVSPPEGVRLVLNLGRTVPQ